VHELVLKMCDTPFTLKINFFMCKGNQEYCFVKFYEYCTLLNGVGIFGVRAHLRTHIYMHVRTNVNVCTYLCNKGDVRK
jgi:hypothetical protein